jgi:tRNA(adenine34) deaminase
MIMNPINFFLEAFYQDYSSHKSEIPSFTQIYSHDLLISESWNEVEKDHSPQNHSEILAMNKALLKLKDKYLLNHHLITTIEPCLMCAGQILKTRLEKVTYFVPARPGEGITGMPLEQIYQWTHIPRFELIPEKRIFSILQEFFKEKR